METELAEMKLLLAQPEPTINYWQPKHLDDYYFVTPILRVDKAIYSANHCDTRTRYRIFQTEAEAQKYADCIKAEETLRKAIAEANEGWLPDCNSFNESKFIVALTYGIIYIRDFRTEKYLLNFMYIKSRELAQQLIKDYEQEFITYLSY